MPLELLPWWADASNGREVDLGWPTQQADLPQIPERQGQRPALLTVSTNVTVIVPPNTPDPRVLIDLAWGNSRTPSLRATIDAGQSCTVAATGLRAAARTPGAAGAAAPQGLVRVSFMVSEALSAAPGAPVTLTDFLQTIAGGATTAVPWPVPPLAYELAVLQSNNPVTAATPIRVQWSYVATAFAADAETQSGAGAVGTSWLAVPKGAKLMRVVNGSAVNATNLIPIWRLSL